LGSTRALTIYLLKSLGQQAEDFIKPDSAETVTPYRLDLDTGVVLFLFVKKVTPRPPRWATFFSPRLSPVQLGSVSSASAVLVVKTSDHWWAVTFGQGRYLLRDHVREDGFGLRVTLNAVGRDNIRSLDKETFDMIVNHARQQASKDVQTTEFGLDIERDLLNAVVGTPRDTALGQRLAGRDALSASIQIELEDLAPYLDLAGCGNRAVCAS
jgi:uncharacterized protein (TIGR04141 family)